MSISRSNEFVLEPLEPRLLLSAVPMAIPLPSAPITAVEFIEAEVVSDDDELGLDGEWIESTAVDTATEAVQLAGPLPAPTAVRTSYLNPDTSQLGIEQQATLLHLANAPPAQRSQPPNTLDLSTLQTPISFLLSADGNVIASVAGEILAEMAEVDRILGGSGDDT
ncbi:MAG: hypothetical protein ACI8W8_003607 [Rhodothermales bacterium]